MPLIPDLSIHIRYSSRSVDPSYPVTADTPDTTAMITVNSMMASTKLTAITTPLSIVLSSIIHQNRAGYALLAIKNRYINLISVIFTQPGRFLKCFLPEIFNPGLLYTAHPSGMSGSSCLHVRDRHITRMRPVKQEPPPNEQNASAKQMDHA